MGSVGGLVVPEVDDVEIGGKAKYTKGLNVVVADVGVSEHVTVAGGVVVLDGVDVVVLEAVGEMLAGAFAKSAG